MDNLVKGDYMINKIKTQHIISLINEFVDLRYGKTVVINYKNKELFNNLRELQFTTEIVDIKTNKDLEVYMKDIYQGVEDKSLFILFDMGNISFSNNLIFAKLLYKLNVKYVMLTKRSKFDTKNTKAFLIFYESYRVFGNVLLLRRLQ